LNFKNSLKTRQRRPGRRDNPQHTIAAKADRLRLEGELNQIEQAGNNIDALLAIPSISAAGLVTEAQRNVTQVDAAIATLALRYKEKHPKMMAARASLADTKEKLRDAVMAQPPILRNAIEQTKATEASLLGALQDQQGVAVALNRAAIGYQELARQAETDRALYESVLRQIKETSLTKDVKTNAVSVIEHSPLPHSPVSPSATKAIALGLLGGLAAGLAFVLGADTLDRSIKTVDQAENTLGLPVFAAVPETTDEGTVTRLKRRRRAFGSSNYRVVVETPESPAAEAFRNLRAALSLLGPEVERKVSLFTSAVPNEGKSFTSANYSLALAQQGYRVLLIDGDLDKCGITLLAGKAVGAPFVGAVAACLAISEVLRLLHGGMLHQLIDLDLQSCEQRVLVPQTQRFDTFNPGYVGAMPP